jgi:T5SS/PEP-CTERM-associated repeat protein
LFSGNSSIQRKRAWEPNARRRLFFSSRRARLKTVFFGAGLGVAFLNLQAAPTTDPYLYWSTNPPGSSPHTVAGPGTTAGASGGTQFGQPTIVTYGPPSGPVVGVSQINYAIDSPNDYGGNIRSYGGSGSWTPANWSPVYILTEYDIGTFPEGGNFQVTVGTVRTTLPPEPGVVTGDYNGTLDTVAFGFTGGTSIGLPPPDSIPQSGPAGADAYTVPLQSFTVAETDAGFFNEPSDSGITFTLGGTYTSTEDASLRGQKITINGSGKFTTPELLVGGNLMVTSGKLHGDETYIDSGFPSSFSEDNLGTPAPSTTITITGGDSILEAPAYLVVGATDNGPASLILQKGAQANVGIVSVGENADSIGALTVDGATLNADNFVQIGGSGTGTLTVKDSGKFNVTTSNGNFTVGNLSGGMGSVMITGAGSSVTVAEQVAVGAPDSTGNILDIFDGGTLTSGDGTAGTYFGVVAGQTGGAFSNSGGSVLIDGAGSMWDIRGSLFHRFGRRGYRHGAKRWQLES